MKKTAGLLIGAFLIAGLSPAAAEDIHQAARDGDAAAVQSMLERNPELVNSKDADDRTPLHWACRGDYPELVVYLVQQGADVNARDKNRIVPLHSLAVRNLAEAADTLIKNGADVNLLNYDGQTALHYAASSDHTDIAQLLTARNAKLEIKDNWGRTPLLLCARERGGPGMTKILINAGADVNVRDKFGATSLNLAAWRGKREVVDALLEGGAVVAVKGREARVLADFAASKGLENLFSRLESGGADLDFSLPTGGTLMHKAAEGGSVPIIQILLKRGRDAGGRDLFGWTPLHYAARDGRAPAMEFLLKQEIDKNVRTVEGKTPYNIAQEFKQKEILQILTAAEVDLGPMVFPRITGDYLGQRPPGDKPEVFALGIVSSIWGLHSSPVFSPDGDTVLWTPMVLAPGALYSTGIIQWAARKDGRWTAPRAASFSGIFDDDVPFFAPDGKTLFFNSSRPLPGQPRSRKERIWFMDRTADRWSEPSPIDAAVNDRDMHWQFSVDRDRNLYLGLRSTDGFGGGDIYCSRFRDGRFQEPENLGPTVNTDKGEGTPFISADGSYLLFQRSLDLWISFQDKKGQWADAVSLGRPINSLGNELCPVVTPDGKYLFFISSRGGENQAFWVDAGIIETLREK